MSKSLYTLEHKTTIMRVRGEVLDKVEAKSLSEAVHKFAIIKQLRPDQLLKSFSVYEQQTNGKRSVKKRS